MKAWHEELQNWEGTAEEMVKQVGRLVGEGVSAEDFAPNVRLLRHYQSIGAVSRPERRGKEAIYGFRQLLEEMVVRTLVLDGWPLAKIAEITSTAGDGDLIDMTPQPGRHRPSPNVAQELVARYSAGDGGGRSSQSRAMNMCAPAGSRRTTDLDEVHEVRSTELRDEEARPGLLELVELEPSPGIRVSIDRHQLLRLRVGDIRALSQAIERALTDARRRVRGGEEND